MNTEASSKALAELADEYWAYECRETPLHAILAGAPPPGSAVFRESVADHDRRALGASAMLAKLDEVDGAGLSPQERATARLLRHELELVHARHAAAAHLRPSLFPAGLDFTSVFWANSTSLADDGEAALYLERLAGLPGALLDIRGALAQGAAEGMFYPKAVLAAASANTRSMLEAAPEATPWMGPFLRSTRNGDEIRRYAGRAHSLIREELLPALAEYARFLDGPLMETARDSLACTDAPAGAALYEVLVRQFTSTGMTPESIHRLGLEEIERIESEVADVAAQAGHAGDVAGYRAFLTADAQFVAPSADVLRQELESLCKRIDGHIPRYFKRIPRAPYGVNTMPEGLSARMPPAYAQPAPADGASAGVLWASGLPAKCPRYLHPALALHEAWPGHLMHIALMQESEGLPAFRRHGAVKYTACIEGWALYCETLGVEMGVYATPHQHYGRLEMELWRAVRLVVDTGIHWYGWSRDRAIAYMRRYLTLPLDAIEGEVDRYAALPAQALAYQIGNLEMRALRRRAEQALGAAFGIRDFHEVVMGSGAVSLPVMSDLVDAWIAGRQPVGGDAHAA